MGGRLAQSAGARCQATRQACVGPGHEVLWGLEFFQPSVFVGREHAIRRAALGQHLLAFKHHMVFEGEEILALLGQQGAHAVVALDRVGLVIVVGINRLGAEFARQGTHLLRGLAVAHDQPGLGQACERAQRRIEVIQAAQNKVHPPVAPGQGVEDVAIQHKHRMHLGAFGQGVVQCGVVGGAQIAAKPNQTGLKAGLARGVCLQH